MEERMVLLRLLLWLLLKLRLSGVVERGLRDGLIGDRRRRLAIVEGEGGFERLEEEHLLLGRNGRRLVRGRRGGGGGDGAQRDEPFVLKDLSGRETVGRGPSEDSLEEVDERR